ISPITLVVEELQGKAVGLGDYVFSTLPLYLTSGVLFGLGAGVYREKDMFTQRPVPLKALDAIESRIYRRMSTLKLSMLFIPFVFAAELLALATLFALPFGVSLPILLLTFAFIEEVAKSVHIYAGYEGSHFKRTTPTALFLGFLSGLGFFIGEKLTLVTQLVGIPELPLGRAGFSSASAVDASPLILVAFLFAPLVLHVVTASMSAVGIRYGRKEYVVAFVIAVLTHTAYNLTVVNFIG
ncbi:MAG: PrsW family intramembrane metalloprotease, partial [Halobacteria archaeon]|nr:PrsW family intramembrane metalloprotease [Halobacteria archaeon]